MEILVFKTSVESNENVLRLAPELNKLAGNDKWNFDLDDCDRILRIISVTIHPNDAITMLSKSGFLCEELTDLSGL